MTIPAFVSMFDKPIVIPHNSINNNRSANRRSRRSNSNTHLIKSASKKTKKIKYSKECKYTNLKELLNHMKFWKLKNEIASYEIPKKEFPEIYHGHFTTSIIKDTNKQIDYTVFEPGNVIQMWKILTKRGQNRHVSCVIWHEGVPHSFSFVQKNESNLSLLSPCNLLEVALARQKANNGEKHYCELLAIGKLNETMIHNFKDFMSKIETPNKTNFMVIERAFNYEKYDDTKQQINKFYKKNIEIEIEKKQKEVETLFKSLGITKRSNNNTNLKTIASKKTKLTEMLEKKFKYGTKEQHIVPLVINIPNSYEIIITNKEYCRYDRSRKSKKKNCMGSLDTIFKDIFSCRIKGTIIIPSLCRPKTGCITRIPDETNV
jgi:hypothetical protein